MSTLKATLLLLCVWCLPISLAVASMDVSMPPQVEVIKKEQEVKKNNLSKIPQRANQYKAQLLREAQFSFGIDAPTASMAAQIHTESLWQIEAKSYVGASGLAQFMPTTATWIAGMDKQLANPNPNNPKWAIRALVRYNKWHFERVTGKSEADKWAFIFCAYNGGLGWVYKDKKLAKTKGYSDQVYFENVELVNAGRRASAFKENRNYIEHIIKHEPAYIFNGWGRGVFAQ